MLATAHLHQFSSSGRIQTQAFTTTGAILRQASDTVMHLIDTEMFWIGGGLSQIFIVSECDVQFSIGAALGMATSTAINGHLTGLL
jgi:hypothetical protein